MIDILIQKIFDSLEYSMMTTFPMTATDFFNVLLSFMTYVLGIFYVVLKMFTSERGRNIIDKYF